MFQVNDTIAAIASAVGPAARMIVRLSGAESHRIASQITTELCEHVRRNRLRISDLEFDAWIYTFRAPRSYTGEDTVEFHLPGNPLLARMLLDELIRRGARHANPGEFTARAYFNGRLDLSQAEGVAAIIAAGSESELRAARQLLAGELARRVKPAMDALADTLALVEVGIDFSEEDVEFLSVDQIRARLDSASLMLETLVRESARLERLHHAPQFVLVGLPNAGKSTLLNALAGEHRAVVSPQAGTTRDALSAEVILPRGMIRLIDVAGIEDTEVRRAAGLCHDPIARQMSDRTHSMLESADRVILVRDGFDDRPSLALAREPDLIVHTKSDLSRALTLSPGTPAEGRGEGLFASSQDDPHPNPNPNPNPLPEYRERDPGGNRELCVSAHTGENMDILRRRLDELAFGTSAGDTLALNARHLNAIAEARESLARARQQLADGGAELLAVELRDALDSLGAILGQVTPDDVLGRIFSSFCIGK